MRPLPAPASPARVSPVVPANKSLDTNRKTNPDFAPRGVVPRLAF